MKIERLAKQIENGDHRAFLKLYDLYINPITIFIQKYVHSVDVAQDLSQDVFVKIWEKRDSLGSIQNFNAYLYRIAKNHTLDYLKKASRLEILPQSIIEEFDFSSNEVELHVAEQEYFTFLDNYIQNLSERSRQIFEMCREHEKTYEEISNELNISKSTVKLHMVSTMKKLQKEIKDIFKISRIIIVILINLFI